MIPTSRFNRRSWLETATLEDVESLIATPVYGLVGHRRTQSGDSVKAMRYLRRCAHVFVEETFGAMKGGTIEGWKPAKRVVSFGRAR